MIYTSWIYCRVGCIIFFVGFEIGNGGFVDGCNVDVTVFNSRNKCDCWCVCVKICWNIYFIVRLAVRLILLIFQCCFAHRTTDTGLPYEKHKDQNANEINDGSAWSVIDATKEGSSH